MDDKEFMQRMENLQKPEVHASVTQKQIRMTILNARASARWSIWVLVIPVVFLGSAIIKYQFNLNFGITDNLVQWISSLDTIPGITIIVFVILPGIAAIMNCLAIMHFSYDKGQNELMIAIKLKWLNILLAAICILIVLFVLMYAIVENAHHRAIDQMENLKTSMGILVDF